MKKSKFILPLVLLSIALVAAYLAIGSYNNSSVKYHTDYLSSDEVAMLRDGDIIIRKGFGFVSNKITELLDEPYNVSHCGIVCNTTGLGGPTVIHSVSSTLSDIDGVQSCNIKRFAAESRENSIIVVRFKDTTSHPSRLIASEAQRYLDAQLPFDNSFDLTDSSEIYCTELVWKILLDKYGHDLYPYKATSRALGFAPLVDTAHFDIVISHNIAVKQH